MLKYRVITALVLIPFVVWSIFNASAQGFTVGLAVVLFISSLEWNNLVAYKNKSSGFIFSIIVTLSFLYLQYLAELEFIQYVIYLSLVWWLMSLPLLFTFPFKSSHLLQKKTAKIIIGFVIILSTFVALNLLRDSQGYGASYVMYLFLIIWIADSGAYFTGRKWGKNKLMPNVSPGKSWEGVAGGMLASFIAALFALDILDVSSSQSILFVLLTLITVVYSVIGDLSESMFKRMANVKDSGKILPGHGGILDRIDSLTSGLPVFLAGLWFMDKLA